MHVQLPETGFVTTPFAVNSLFSTPTVLQAVQLVVPFKKEQLLQE